MRYSINLEPIAVPAPTSERILVIAPHPDDEMLGPGGTLIQAIERGSSVLVLYLTKGPEKSGDVLEREARQVAAAVGYSTCFLNYHSRDIPLDDTVLDQIQAAIDEARPSKIFLPFFADDHDDHRRASHLLWLLHRRRKLQANIEVWAYQVYSAILPNVVVDITRVADRKGEMIGIWQSQKASRDWAHFALGLNAHNTRFFAGQPGVRYAEGFFALPAAEYLRVCSAYFEKPADQVYYTPRYVVE